jgi:AbrB family looped-hinge helix DNA binding protein
VEDGGWETEKFDLSLENRNTLPRRRYNVFFGRVFMESRPAMQARVSAKGWVVIPAKLRRRFGLKPGATVEFEATDQGILVTPGAADPVDTLYGKLAGKTSLTKDLLEERARELKREEKHLRAR